MAAHILGGTFMQESRQRLFAGPKWAGTHRYSVVRKVGEGGVGIVYEVLDRDAHRTVALKTLLRVDADSVYRFNRSSVVLATHRVRRSIVEVSASYET